MRISDWSSDVCSSDLNTVWLPSPAQATGAEEFAAACSLGRLGSHLTARNRWPVTMSASLEHSHKVGGTIASGWISWARSKPACRGTDTVFLGPHGTRALAVNGTGACWGRVGEAVSYSV